MASENIIFARITPEKRAVLDPKCDEVIKSHLPELRWMVFYHLENEDEDSTQDNKNEIKDREMKEHYISLIEKLKVIYKDVYDKVPTKEERNCVEDYFVGRFL